MSAETNVLIVLTSHATLGRSNEPTGFWLEEFTTPYFAFADAGARVEIASIRGGQPPIDPRSVKQAGDNPASVERYLRDSSLQALLAATASIESLQSATYDIVYLPGGHGTMWDFPGDQMLERLIAETLGRGAVVSTVCHGAAGLVTAKSPDGRSVVAGRRLTAFTDAEEESAGLTEVVPFLLESRLKSLGARFESGANFASFAIADDNLVTGQNPASSRRVAELALAVSRQRLRSRDPLRSLMAVESSAAVPRISTAALLAAPENESLRDLLTGRAADVSLLEGKRIAVITTDGVEEIELTATLQYFRDRGASVEILSPARPTYPERFGVQIPAIRETHILTVRYMEEGGWVAFDRKLDAADPAHYAAVIVPGGAWNPDTLRADPAALAFISSLAKAGRPVAALCHGPWVLADAGVLRGRRATSWWSMQKDIAGAGGTYVDEAVVVDGNIITSRAPIDLPEFLDAVTRQLTFTGTRK
jgi:protease I